MVVTRIHRTVLTHIVMFSVAQLRSWISSSKNRQARAPGFWTLPFPTNTRSLCRTLDHILLIPSVQLLLSFALTLRAWSRVSCYCRLLGYGTTSCCDVVWPAVSIRGGEMASFDSEQGPTAPTTNLFNSASLSDADLGCLFSSASSPAPDFHFFTDGLPCTEQETSHNIASDFSFDQLVDFDACQTHSDDFLHETNETNDDDQTQQSSSSFLTPLSSSKSPAHPNQTATTSSALQPCLGASS